MKQGEVKVTLWTCCMRSTREVPRFGAAYSSCSSLELSQIINSIILGDLLFDTCIVTDPGR